MSPGCPPKLIAGSISALFPGSCPGWQGSLSPPPSHTRSRASTTAVTQPGSRAGLAERRDPVLSAGGFTSCWCLPSAENTSGKCGSEIFPQLPRPCCEQPCSQRPSPEA